MKLAGGQSFVAFVGSILLIVFSQSFCNSPEIHIEMGYDYEGYNTFKLGPSLLWPGDGFYFEALKSNSFSLTPG